MVSDKLGREVKKQLKSGYSKEEIKKALLSAGYSGKDIEEALSGARPKESFSH